MISSKSPSRTAWLHGLKRVRATGKALDRSPGRPLEQRQGAVKRPVGRLAVADVRHEQSELTWTGSRAALDRRQQARRRRRAVRHDKHPLNV
jgi:hypothetical protein